MNDREREWTRLGLPFVPCGLCGESTTSTGTKRCDRCWELESRVKADPALARRILLVNP